MSQINALSSLDPALGNTDISRFGEMTSEDFVRVIFAELANQETRSTPAKKPESSRTFASRSRSRTTPASA